MIRLLRLGEDISVAQASPELIPLIKRFHRLSKAPFSFGNTLQQLPVIPLNPLHEFVIAVDDGRYVGYLWAEVQPDRNYWIHQVFAPGGGVSKAFLAYAERAAERLGCVRLAGFFWRGREEAEIYCKRFNLRIAAILVERSLNGREE